jgi:membrane associated rhomboid family serine protease
LADAALDTGVRLPSDIRTRVEAEREKPGFPTPAFEKALEAADPHIAAYDREAWSALLARYTDTKRVFAYLGTPFTSLFYAFGAAPGRPWFPGLLTYQFLHLGFAHLFFNMLFLWIVGCNMEERWGKPIFFFLYLTGGMAAAYVQHLMQTSPNVVAVGASGSVAAVMGAFLVRHYRMPIKFFYFFWPVFRVLWGQFLLPAWVVLPAWFLQQLALGMVSLGQAGGGVGYWAHVGGFAYGALFGLLIRRGGIAEAWETDADETPRALDLRVEEASRRFHQGEIDAALQICREVLLVNPNHFKALSGLLAIYERRADRTQCAKTALRLFKGFQAGGEEDRAAELLYRWGDALAEIPLEAPDRMAVAQSLERAKQWQGALAHYRAAAEAPEADPYRGKALFAAGRILRDHLKRVDEAAACFQRLRGPDFSAEWRAAAEEALRAPGVPGVP